MNRKSIIQGLAGICLLLLCPGVSLQAQGWKLMSREEIEAQVHPDLLKGAHLLLRFDTCRLSVGKMLEEDPPREVTFRFRNTGRQPLTLTRISTSCGCTVAQFSKAPLAPGQEGQIQLTFHPRNRPGTVDVEALVYATVSDRSPVAKLTLDGYVQGSDEWNHLPKAMGHLRLTRKQLVFRVSEQQIAACQNGQSAAACQQTATCQSGQSAAAGVGNSNQSAAASSQPKVLITERILCGNSGDRPLTLKTQLLPACLTFRTEPEVLSPGQEGDLVITLDVRKMLHSTNAFMKQTASVLKDDAVLKKFSFMIEGVEGKPSERMIEVLVYKD